MALKYLLVLLTFVHDKLPDDGILLPKHVAVGTCYEVYSVMYFILLYTHANYFILLVLKL